MAISQDHDIHREHDFEAHAPVKYKERLVKAAREEGSYIITSIQKLFLGISARTIDAEEEVEVGFSAHDGTYSMDFAVRDFSTKGSKEEVAATLTEYIIAGIRRYTQEHDYKFIGAGVARAIVDLCPTLPARMWADMDIVPLIFDHTYDRQLHKPIGPLPVDEEADTMVRRCLMYYGPGDEPRIEIGFKNQVEVDVNGRAQLTYLEQYKETVGERTWEATMRYAQSLKERNIKIAFFSSTPQGGGVALMRHALIRFLRLVGVNVSWYVPRPRPEVFRITKTNHNILQGVADPDKRLTDEQAQILDEWAENNAKRFWLVDGGSLAPRSKGGADVIIVDDPQMPSLVTLSKQVDPDRPVIFRSHIQVRSDLVDQPGTATSEVWDWLYKHAKAADVFISHPVREFVPKKVDFKTVGYMPATTDWLDGLNKELAPPELQYYIQQFNNRCHEQRMPPLAFGSRDYIIQVARFDPAKGITDVIASYAELRRNYLKGKPRKETPQLVLCGHGAVDDPDGSLILDQVLDLLEQKYSDIADDVVVMRLGPVDQFLNALLSGAKVALQLSTREGFEVKVSEALHKGIPIIATKTGGIPLQVHDKKSGFLVEPHDAAAVAKYLHQLFTDEELHERMSKYAATHVSDEVSTVGNALCWLYLADTLSKGEKLQPNGAWINDLARQSVGLKHVEGEVKLPRQETT